MTGRWFVSAGDVVEVQLAADAFPDENPKKKRKKNAPAPRRRAKRMRIFLRESDGKDQTYDYENCQLGVRAQQRVAVVRGAVRGVREPAHLMLCNLSTGEQEIFERTLAVFLTRKPTFSPFWQALVMAGVVWIATVAAGEFGFSRGAALSSEIWFGAFVAFVLFWPLWGIAYTWSHMTARSRFRKARESFIADVESRVRAYAPSMR